MIKTRLKIGFFEAEIEYVLELQQQLEQIRSKLKQAIIQAHTNFNVNSQNRILSNACLHYQNLIREIKEQAKSIKIKSDLFIDEARYEGEVIFKSMEQKVEDLNERLYQAQQGVQKAENIKKSIDHQKTQYKMSNVINFKSVEKAAVINRYIEAEQKIKTEFKRGINLIMRTNDRMLKLGRITELQKQLKMAAMGISYHEMKRVQNFCILERTCKSQQKIIQENQKDMQISKREPLVAILIKSPHLKYKKLRESSLQELVTNLRESNKKQTISNKLFQTALQLKNKNQVLKYLQSKQTLTEEESIMKLQLMSDKLNQFVDEKILSLKHGKKSKQFDERTRQESKMIKKNSKSLQKLEFKEQRKFKLRKSNTKVNLKKQFRQQFASYTSNQKTNDSIN